MDKVVKRASVALGTRDMERVERLQEDLELSTVTQAIRAALKIADDIREIRRKESQSIMTGKIV